MAISSTIMNVAKFRFLKFSPKFLMYAMNCSLNVLYRVTRIFEAMPRLQIISWSDLFYLPKACLMFLSMKCLYMFYLRMWCKSHLNLPITGATFWSQYLSFVLDNTWHFKISSRRECSLASILEVPHVKLAPDSFLVWSYSQQASELYKQKFKLEIDDIYLCCNLIGKLV